MASPSSGSQPEETSTNEDLPPLKNDGQEMTPVLCTAPVPRAFLTQVITTAQEAPEGGYKSLVFLTTSSARKLNDIMSFTASADDILPERQETFTSPFIGWDIKQCYAFIKSHIRDPDAGFRHGWARYTFVILDAQSVDDHTALLCSDSPDLGERGNEVILKTARVPLENLGTLLQTVETLVGNLSEHVAGYKQVLSQHPPACYEPSDKPGVFRIAGERLARRNRRTALQDAEEDGVVAEERVEFARGLRVEGTRWELDME